MLPATGGAKHLQQNGDFALSVFHAPLDIVGASVALQLVQLW